MASCFDVAAFFLLKAQEAGMSITNLKLQKLVYYAQGFSLAINKRPLFEEPVVAWNHGPVVECLYHEYKGYGKDPIPVPTNVVLADLFQEDDFHPMELVFEAHGRKSAWELRQQTHREPTWLEHSINDNIADSSEITVPELDRFFSSTVMNDNYITDFMSDAEQALVPQNLVEMPSEIQSADDFISWIRCH